METTKLLTAAQWAAILTVIFGAITTLAWILQWGIKFRLVGVTAFMGVITAGIFGLGLGLYTRTAVPGAVPYSLVYDNGGTKTVIAVPPEITKSELEATMQQAAGDLFSPGRLGLENQMMIKVRTIIHPESGVSQPLYLGEVKRSLSKREDKDKDIKIFPEAFSSLEEFVSSIEIGNG